MAKVGKINTLEIPADYPQKLKPSGVRWVVPGWGGFGTSTGAPFAGYLIYEPIFVSETTTYIRIGINVNVAAAGLVRLGIYNWSDGLPGTLVLDAGTVDVSTTGAKEITISQQLTRGYYFLAFVADVEPTLTTPAGTQAIWAAVPGLSSSNQGGASFQLYILATSGRVGDVAGGLPNPAPAPDTKYNIADMFVCLREN